MESKNTPNQLGQPESIPNQLGQEVTTPEEKKQSFWEKEISRRDALKIGVATFLTGLNAVLAKNLIDRMVNQNQPQEPNPTPDQKPPTQSPTERPRTPEVLATGIEFGFNTHLNNEAQNMNLELFKRCVEDLSANGQSWIRFNLKDNANSQVLADFDQAVNYAKQKGLKITLVTNPPDAYNSKSIAEYYRSISQRFKGKIDVWQIFNESNAHHFKDYSPRPRVDSQYLKDFSQAVATASSAIKQIDPSTKVTINTSNWIGDHRDTIGEGDAFFGSVKDSIDIITLDLYPDNPDSEPGKIEVAKYPSYISHFKQKFGKDVMIGEIGWPTFQGMFSPQDQANNMMDVMSAFQSGNTKPIAVLFYEWADEQGVGDVENAFGANDSNGRPKDHASYQQLLNSMRPQKTSELPVKTSA